MAQTAKQRAASLRNLVLARAAFRAKHPGGARHGGGHRTKTHTSSYGVAAPHHKSAIARKIHLAKVRAVASPVRIRNVRLRKNTIRR